jgi:nucleoside-diphosphate-sugar epimerase
MSAPKLIVVIGATGNQGGSVVSTFLDDPCWRVRGITRNPSSPKAASLRSRSVEVVQADMDEPASLAVAFEGANAIFAVSDFWTIYNDPANKDKPEPSQPLNEWTKERETQQLKNVIDAAAQVPTLERFVLSSLPNVTKLSGGKYTHVCHFDSKANAAEYGRETYPDLWAKTSLYTAGLFLSNLVSHPAGKPTKVG